jgi:hypothetical protein
MWSDLLISIAVLPWLGVGGFFVFIFLEWSGRDRGAQDVLRKGRDRDSARR